MYHIVSYLPGEFSSPSKKDRALDDSGVGAAAAAAAPTPESSNARSFFEGLLNSPGK